MTRTATTACRERERARESEMVLDGTDGGRPASPLCVESGRNTSLVPS